MIIIRRLNHGEGKLYREVRLASLVDSPAAFSSLYTDAVVRSEVNWDEQADSSATGVDRATFVAVGDGPVALAAIYRDENNFNVGELIQMWVAPRKRGVAVAEDLLHALLQWAASSGFLRVKAEVMTTNLRALQFYKKCGFSESSEMASHSSSSIMLTIPIENEGDLPRCKGSPKR